MTKGLPRSLKSGDPALRNIVKVKHTFSESIDVTGVADTVDAGSIVIGGLPEGNILLLGAVAYAAVAGGADAHIIDDWDGDYGVGTAPNADVDLGDAEDDNIIPSTALASASDDKDAPLTRGVSTATEQVIIDNTAGAMEINLNLLIDDNVITDTEDGTFAISGTIDLAFIVLGDD
jgi:predicted  nucleic acid-binding Zn-ribbon protein